MRVGIVILLFLVLTLPCPVSAGDRPDYRMVEDYSGACASGSGELSYYYHIPVTPDDRSWYQAYPWHSLSDTNPRNYIIGQFFTIGDISTGQVQPADPTTCHLLRGFRIMDQAGYACVYPEYWGHWIVEFDVYCSDEYGCPLGPSLWNSGPLETCYGWNYLEIDPLLSICNCSLTEGPPPSEPRILLTATHLGTEPRFPRWGLDIISWNYNDAAEMHDIGCLPALFPRPYNSHYPTMHSGYYGPDFQYCPPLWFKDHEDPSADGSVYGYCELAWRIYLECSGPSQAQQTTWGTIKGMYR